ncbi:MAG: alpha-ketoglutarate-dependent dioxygenase AlkB [Chitinophagaceae bacterium]|nr:alpha-ketoglutarate-dependent dioxygenase AlkB [Chitinophagaceae bacterium]
MTTLADNLLPYGGELYYYSDVISRAKSEEYFNQLFAEIRWKQEPVKIFGKEILQPRLTAWYGDVTRPYSYSGITMQPNHWIHPLLEIKHLAEKYSGAAATSALMNLYRDGNDGLGWHRDNEKSLGPQPTIASVSLGAPRTFQLRNYKEKKPVISLELQPGSLVVMKGESQIVWEHRIPKSPKFHGARINITFRNIL